MMERDEVTHILSLINGADQQIAEAKRRDSQAMIKAYTKLRQEFVADLVAALNRRNISVKAVREANA
ncbi:MAG: hypothetical protein AB8G22_10480 [Saprospiraceae bacterium]